MVVIASLSAPSNDTTMECLLLVSTLKRNGAKSVTVVEPYSSYARQDKPFVYHRTLASADIHQYLELSGADRVLTVDIHNPATIVSHRSYNPRELSALKSM